MKAHGSFICGENGRGVAEMFKCEKDVDLFVGTLSKAGGCVGGFISCRQEHSSHLIFQHLCVVII